MSEHFGTTKISRRMTLNSTRHIENRGNTGKDWEGNTTERKETCGETLSRMQELARNRKAKRVRR
jgi:hypothetical protein